MEYWQGRIQFPHFHSKSAALLGANPNPSKSKSPIQGALSSTWIPNKPNQTLQMPLLCSEMEHGKWKDAQSCPRAGITGGWAPQARRRTPKWQSVKKAIKSQQMCWKSLTPSWKYPIYLGNNKIFSPTHTPKALKAILKQQQGSFSTLWVCNGVVHTMLKEILL